MLFNIFSKIKRNRRFTAHISRLCYFLWLCFERIPFESMNPEWQKQPKKVFYKKKLFLKILIFIGKYLCWSLFLIKLKAYEGLCHNNLRLKALDYCCKALHRPATLLKRDSSLRVLILRAPTLKNICEWLRLEWRFIKLTVLPEFNQFLQRLSHSIYTVRSSHGRCFIKKGVHEKFTKFTVKHLCQSLFL